MGNEEHLVKCAMCGNQLSTDDKECPLCHSILMCHVKNNGIPKTQIVTEFGIKQTDRKTGFRKKKMRIRRKKSNKTELPAMDSLTIDRTSDEVTVKTHKVLENDKQGKWITVHDEQMIFKAKRRKK